MGNTEQAEQAVLQGVRAEKNGNLKQAIVHYRQALEYCPESFQGRQLLTKALMKIQGRHQVKAVRADSLEQRGNNPSGITSAVSKRDRENYQADSQEKSLKLKTSAPVFLSTEISTLQLKAKFSDLGSVKEVSDSSSALELESKPTDKFLLMPTIDKMREEPLLEKRSVAEVYVGQALAYFEQKQWNKSIAACQEALRVFPEMGVAYKVWGNCLQRAGQSTEAIGIYAKALEAKADMAEIYCNLGSIYAKQKKWQRAIEHYQKSTIINPNNASPYRNLARVWNELKEYDRSADCFFKAIDLQPNLLSAQNHFSLANNLISEGNLTRAIASYKSCVELEPDFLNAYARLADALEADGQTKAALFYYKKLAKLQTEVELPSPQQSKSSQQISSFLKQSKASTKALPASTASNGFKALPSQTKASSSKADVDSANIVPKLQPAQQTRAERMSAALQAAARQPNSATVQFELGNLSAEEGQWQTALSYYQQAVKLAPQSAKYHLKLARMWEKLKQPAKANLAFYEAFSLQSSKVSARNHYLLGDKLLQHQETKRAIACYRRAVSIKSDFIEAYWRLGEISLAQGKHKIALACYNRALKIAPNRVQNYILVAKTLTNLKNWSAAISYYQKAVTLEPNNAEIYTNLGEVLIYLQRHEDAVETLQQAIGHNPQSWRAYHLLGDALSQQELWQKALGAYEKAVLFNADSYSLTYYYLGLAHFKLKQYQEAVKAFHKSIELNDSSSWSYYHLGSTLCMLEQWSAAAEALGKSIELHPDFDWAYHKLGNAKAEIKDWDGAINAYRQALAITPDLPKTEDKLNEVLRQRSKLDLEGVTKYYKASLERDPLQESAYFKALEVSPENPEIYIKLAKLYQSQDNFEQAIAFLKIALQIQPDNLETVTALNELQAQLS